MRLYNPSSKILEVEGDPRLNDEMPKFVHEFILDEHSYHDRLEILVGLSKRLYDSPSYVPKQTTINIFSNVEDLLDLSSTMLSEFALLSSQGSELAIVNDMVEILDRTAFKFQVYSVYLSNLDNALETVRTCRDKNLKFAAMLTQENIELTRLMSLPQGRIRQYEHFADSICRQFSTSTKFNEFMDILEYSVFYIQQTHKVAMVQERLFSGLLSFVKPGRFLVHFWFLQVSSPMFKKTEPQELSVVLFNDIFLLARKESGTNRIMLAFYLRDLVVLKELSDADPDLKDQHGFYIKDRASGDQLTLYATSLAERGAWMSLLDRTMSIARDIPGSLHENRSAYSEVIKVKTGTEIVASRNTNMSKWMEVSMPFGLRYYYQLGSGSCCYALRTGISGRIVSSFREHVCFTCKKRSLGVQGGSWNMCIEHISPEKLVIAHNIKQMLKHLKGDDSLSHESHIYDDNALNNSMGDALKYLEKNTVLEVEGFLRSDGDSAKPGSVHRVSRTSIPDSITLFRNSRLKSMYKFH